MKAGFARVRITPAVGTRMTGFGGRDRDRGCEGIHDDPFVRALYLAHEGKEVLIVGFDLLFFSRDEVDRYKGAIGRRIDLRPSQILLNTSHTHSGPKVGTWNYDPPSDPFYLQELEYAMVKAACQARDATTDVTLWAGSTRSKLPMSRRKRGPDGKVFWAPSPEAEVCTALPICLLKDSGGKPICLLFSVSCHPSTISGFDISAEYPGVAMGLLDQHLGFVGSLFLQGAGGEAKPSVTAEPEGEKPRFRPGTWADVTAAGRMVADEVIQALNAGLVQIEPDICTCTVEMEWPMGPTPDLAGYETMRSDPKSSQTVRLWAEEKIGFLRRGYHIPASVPITVHGVQLGKGLRLVGIEGEAVARLGNIVLEFYREGVTFPMGYTDGTQAYLPSEEMLNEDGYEVVSFYEYRQPARFSKGINHILKETLRRLRACGVR